MLKNYFKIALRNVTRHKAYSAINIFGLAIGISACLLIIQYVDFELSYENFHSKKDRIFRLEQDRFDNGKISTQWAAGAFGAANSFKNAIPEIEDYVKVVDDGSEVTKVNNKIFKIDKAFFSSKSFFNIFSYPLLVGDPNTVLVEPNTAVISESTSRTLFGDLNATGKTLLLSGHLPVKITGIFKDMPANTQLQTNMLISYSTFVAQSKKNGDDAENAWEWDGCLSYLLLRPDADPKKVEAKLDPVAYKFVADDMKKYNAAVKYHLQPISDIHLYSHFMGEPSPTGDGKTVYLLLGIAFFIIVIAWVNYINLATARAINRAREVGVRKAIGSKRNQLVRQFLFESALLNGIALVLALVIIFLTLPLFSRLAGQEITFTLFARPGFWLTLFGLYITGVFLSGLYPAFVLSSFNPVEVLKGKIISGRQGSVLRKSLVVFQFAASLFLLIGTTAVYKQIQFMRRQSLGVNIDQTLVVNPPIVTDSTFTQRTSGFKDELLRNPAIRSVAASTSVPGDEIHWNAGGIKLVGANESQQKQYRIIGVDYDFIHTFGLKIIAGRPFAKEFATDSNAVVFNRKGIGQLGFNKPEEAIGKKIDFWGHQYTIVGVSENFHQQSLRDAYDALIFRLIPAIRGYFSVKLNTEDAAKTVDLVKQQWAVFFPGNTFDYFFLDEHFDHQYKADQRFGQVFGLFTTLAILVACLGLFGLASFTTLQRTKEIGIRKVLGASVAGILRLLYEEFAILLLIAFVVATPIAWFGTHKWLQSYAFRIQLSWLLFLLPFVIIVLIAFLTVSYQSMKAAWNNPVKSLRTE
ncbi:MAG: ABC transporter permease [Bacteroidetes bacterium]|nr:MAG: ABC transporter permease [Bacteroidota bacterium]